MGTSVTASCASCDRTVSASGCSGVIAIYKDTSGCSGTPCVSFAADGTCNVMAGVIDGASYIYTASPTGVTCNAGTAAATPDVTGPGTICCP